MRNEEVFIRHMVQHQEFQSEDCPCVEMLALPRFQGLRAVNGKMIRVISLPIAAIGTLRWEHAWIRPEISMLCSNKRTIDCFGVRAL